MPLTATGGGAKPYRARKLRQGLRTGLKAYTKIKGGSLRKIPNAPAPSGATRKPLPQTQTRMPMKQNFPVPPIPGQKTPSGKVKMYAARKKQVKAAGTYFKKRGKNF